MNPGWKTLAWRTALCVTSALGVDTLDSDENGHPSVSCPAGIRILLPEGEHLGTILVPTFLSRNGSVDHDPLATLANASELIAVDDEWLYLSCFTCRCGYVDSGSNWPSPDEPKPKRNAPQRSPHEVGSPTVDCDIEPLV